MTASGRYIGTRGEAGWTPCWECKRPHDEHCLEPAGAGDGLTCPLVADKLDPALCRRLATELAEDGDALGRITSVRAIIDAIVRVRFRRNLRDAVDQLTAVVDLAGQPDVYRAMVIEMLASARPHPVRHPTMAAAWAHARELLRNDLSPVCALPHPTLTADEVRSVVREAVLEHLLPSHEEARAQWSRIDPIADRVAEKLAGCLIGTKP